MKNLLKFSSLLIVLSFFACANEVDKTSSAEASIEEVVAEEHTMEVPDDDRISLDLLPKQKRHQLQNMRAHLVAVQTIIELISKDNYDLASKVASAELGSSTEMQLMCASFGNENFEKLGLDFHASADKMSEIIKTKDKQKSLEALSVTMNYCITCHASFKQ